MFSFLIIHLFLLFLLQDMLIIHTCNSVTRSFLLTINITIIFCLFLISVKWNFLSMPYIVIINFNFIYYTFHITPQTFFFSHILILFYCSLQLIFSIPLIIVKYFSLSFLNFLLLHSNYYLYIYFESIFGNIQSLNWLIHFFCLHQPALLLITIQWLVCNR
jgi:hypothetical protein